MRTIYREKKYYCGEYLDVFIYPTFKQAKQRSRKSKPTTEAQQKLNARHSEEKLVRLLHANFTPDDLELGLDHAVNPADDEEAKRDVQNFVRRLKRLYKKLGIELKYIVVTEKSSKGRYHHHVTISGGADRDVIENLWGLGRANSKRLQFDEHGVAALGHYIVKSPIFDKRWNASKNLIDPPPRTSDSRISARKANELSIDSTDREPYEALYPDYILAEARPFHNDVNGGTYIFARLYRKDGRFMRPGKRRKNHE